MKCEITGEAIQTTFLGKILGTVVKDSKGKKHFVSAQAQRALKNDKVKILESIK